MLFSKTVVMIQDKGETILAYPFIDIDKKKLRTRVLNFCKEEFDVEISKGKYISDDGTFQIHIFDDDIEESYTKKDFCKRLEEMTSYIEVDEPMDGDETEELANLFKFILDNDHGNLSQTQYKNGYEKFKHLLD